MQRCYSGLDSFRLQYVHQDVLQQQLLAEVFMTAACSSVPYAY